MAKIEINGETAAAGLIDRWRHATANGLFYGLIAPRVLRPVVTVWATITVLASPGQRVTSASGGFVIRKRSGLRAVVGTITMVLATLPLALADLLPPAQAAVGYGVGLIGTLLVAPQVSFALDWFKTRSIRPQPTHIADAFIAYRGSPLGSGIRLVRKAIDQLAPSPAVIALTVRKAASDYERLSNLYRRLGFVQWTDSRQFTLDLRGSRATNAMPERTASFYGRGPAEGRRICQGFLDSPEGVKAYLTHDDKQSTSPTES